MVSCLYSINETVHIYIYKGIRNVSRLMFRHKQKEYFPKCVVEQRSRVDRGEAELLNSSLAWLCHTQPASGSCGERLWLCMTVAHSPLDAVMPGPSFFFLSLSLVFCGHWQNTVILWIAWSQPEAETARLTHTDSIATVSNDDATREWFLMGTEMEMLFCIFRMWCTLKDLCFWQPVMRFFK